MATSGRLPPFFSAPPSMFRQAPRPLCNCSWTCKRHDGCSGPARPRWGESGLLVAPGCQASSLPPEPLPSLSLQLLPSQSPTSGPGKGPLDQRHTLAWEGWAPGSPGALSLLTSSQTGTLTIVRAVPFCELLAVALLSVLGWVGGGSGHGRGCRAAGSHWPHTQLCRADPVAVPLNFRGSKGLAGGWAEWLPDFDQPECVPEATVVPTALAAHQGHAGWEGQQCQARAGAWGPSRSAGPSVPGPSLLALGRQPGAWPLFGPVLIVVLIVIMKMLGERASLHCDVKLEVIS
uniref:Uncharacterized protein n=1 Tax=Molossus molossus TaxID=27622 RepID=A0A7J8HGU0_MOLMO|nr:hypothetical protein HJG59_010912 [Molossus molossus]